MINQIVNTVEQNGYQRMRIDVKGVFIYFLVVNQKVYVVNFIDFNHGDEINKEDYEKQRRLIQSSFWMKGFSNIEILSIICTTYPDKVKEIGWDQDCFWIVDLLAKRLIIYENQVGDFLNIRKLIEDTLEESRKPRQVPICTAIIVIINIIVFITIELTGSSLDTEYMLRWGAMYWPYVIYNNQYYRLITHVFLHFGIQHLFNNMLILGVIGINLEKVVGKRKYIFIYLASGILAGLVSMGYNIMQNTIVTSAGASGAIFGVVGAMTYIVAVNKGRVLNISTTQLIFFVILSLYNGFINQHVDNAAHVGGLIAGVFLAILLYRKPKVKGSDEHI